MLEQINDFSLLRNRLFSLSNQSVYVHNFDCEALIEKLKLSAFDSTNKVAIEQLSICLDKIEHLLSIKKDFHAYFLTLHEERTECLDEYGNICVEEIKEYIPLQNHLKEGINNDINVELNYYKINLKALLNDFDFRKIRKKTLSISHPNTLAKLVYINEASEPTKITNLCQSLKRQGFISNNTKINDFKKIFIGKSQLNKRIHWCGDISALHYFIKELFRKNIVHSRNGLGKWENTLQLFSLSENGEWITSDLKSQKPPKTKMKILDVIINAFA